MKPLLPFILFLLPFVFGCKPEKKDRPSADSTQIAADTSAVEETSYVQSSNSTYTPPPSSLFPEYSESTYTEDPNETVVSEKLARLIEKYDFKDYLTITRDYAYGYKKEIGPEEYDDVSESETKTWFFDSLYNLRAYTRNFSYLQGSEGYSNATTIYLFSNDSLIAAYKDEDESVEEAYKIHTRIMASTCPECGVRTSAHMSDIFNPSILVKSDLVEMSEYFNKEYKAVINWMKYSETPRKDESGYRLTEKATYEGYPTDGSGAPYTEDDVPYNIEYVLSPGLFEKLIKDN
jgi:hypothetical protein